MSRCYPFPPPGFVPKEIKKDESLIESIKKGTKEECKREKKDRKHNKDKKRKERETEAGRSRKHHHHKRQRNDASKKVDDNDPECLEKSSLTMELDHQRSSSQTSSESTLHSNEKNERPNHIQSQPLDGRHNNDSETNMDQKQCSSPEMLDTPPSDASRVCQEKRRDQVFDISTELCKEKETNRQTSMRLNKEKRSSRHHHEATGPSKLCRKRPSSTAMRFLNLIENWSPDGVESKLTDSEDQEWWLLMKVGSKRHGQVSVQTSSSSGSSSMVWPSARFLPEAELHALPFTVPF